MKTVTITTTKTVTVDERQAIDDLKKLYGYPPYNGCNPCRGDWWFAKSIEGNLKKEPRFIEIRRNFPGFGYTVVGIERA